MQWTADEDLRQSDIRLALARAGIAKFPDRLELRLTMVWTLHTLGRWGEAAACLREASAAFADSADLHYALAAVLREQDALEEALAEAERALALSPQHRSARRLCFDLLTALERWEAARLVAHDIASVEPIPGKSAFLHAGGLTRTARAQAMVSRCDALLAKYPGHTDATYFKAIALAQLERRDEARETIRLDRIVDVRDLPTPLGYANAAAFRAALVAEIERNPSRTSRRRGQAFRNAERIVQLRQPDAAAVEALLGLIRNAVDDYERRQIASDTDLYASRPELAKLSSWATISGRDGYERVHRHSGGWLSGVFYACAPRPAGEETYRGRLVLGALDPVEHGVEPPWGTQEVEPVPGRLVLFPSYLPHTTEPTGVDGARITIAFDVSPAEHP